MLAILKAVPFKKEIGLVLLSVLLIVGYGFYWYEKGYAAADQTAKVQRLEQRITTLETDLESAKATKEIVIEYKDKIITLEKQVPVYVNTVEEIFAYDDSVIVPDRLARLHDDIVCGETYDANTACRAAREAAGPVTLGQFSKAVVGNYARCKADADQLGSLIDWVSIQNKIINESTK